ncbi:uncharacterized protein METZ01_LOCUS382270 [marine metagenome]|uniref:Co-chaperone DjlA N-terminal domain-containing protein n=1 Tax=marine metagenome TaxID=408172 RepID=A0A382U533_9ZZZZ
MLNRISSLFLGSTKTDLEGEGNSRMQLAAAALLIEAAYMDEQFDESERAVISDLVRRRFDLELADSERLLFEAESAVAKSQQLYEFTRAVNDRFTPEQRIELMEMLWEVVYADGRVHDFEVSLLRRLGGLLYVSDQDRALARQRVVQRLGQS